MAGLAGILVCALTACKNTNPTAAKALETTTTNETEVPQEGTDAQEESIQTANAQDAETEGEETPQTDAALGNSLVVYFSWSGNTRTVAEEIGKQTGE